MPLLVFLGDSPDGRRKPSSVWRRIANAAKRGWTEKRIAEHRKKHGHHCKNRSSGKGENGVVANRGGGANHKGEGKGNGKGANKGKGKDESCTRGRGGGGDGKRGSSWYWSSNGWR